MLEASFDNRIVLEQTTAAMPALLRPHQHSHCLAMLVHGDDLLPFVENALGTLRNSGNGIPVLIWVSPQTSASAAAMIGARYGAKTQHIVMPEAVDARYSDYGTAPFNAVVSLKYQLLLKTMDLGYETVIYADCDIAFIADFSQYLVSASTVYAAGIQSDALPCFPPQYCTGFMYFTRAAQSLLERLHIINIRCDDKTDDQMVFNALIKQEPELMRSVLALPESLFQNGLQYRHYHGRRFKESVGDLKPFLFHANWIFGLKNKRRVLRRIGLWHSY
jgi:hypothetical protein